MTDENKDLGTQGAEDTVKEKLKEGASKVHKNIEEALGKEEMEAKGKAREVSGKAESKEGASKVHKNIEEALGKEEMEAKGKAHEVSGKAESKAGDVERKADDASSS